MKEDSSGILRSIRLTEIDRRSTRAHSTTSVAEGLFISRWLLATSISPDVVPSAIRRLMAKGLLEVMNIDVVKRSCLRPSESDSKVSNSPRLGYWSCVMCISATHLDLLMHICDLLLTHGGRLIPVL